MLRTGPPGLDVHGAGRAGPQLGGQPSAVLRGSGRRRPRGTVRPPGRCRGGPLRVPHGVPGARLGRLWGQNGPRGRRRPAGPHSCGWSHGHVTLSLSLTCRPAAGAVRRVGVVAASPAPFQWAGQMQGRRPQCPGSGLGPGGGARAQPLAATATAATCSPESRSPFCARGEGSPELALWAPRAGEQHGRADAPGGRVGCRPSVRLTGLRRGAWLGAGATLARSWDSSTRQTWKEGEGPPRQRTLRRPRGLASMPPADRWAPLPRVGHSAPGLCSGQFPAADLAAAQSSQPVAPETQMGARPQPVAPASPGATHPSAERPQGLRARPTRRDRCGSPRPGGSGGGGCMRRPRGT